MASRHNKLHADQRGLVSFMIVTVLMLITTLIVLSFARLVSREQIQTLDRQLNAQAQYAAESGVNDAVYATTANSDLLDAEYTECDSFIDEAVAQGTLTDEDPNLDENVSYSCLLVDPSVPDLDLNVNTQTSTVVRIKPAERVINRLKLSWASNLPTTPDMSGCGTAGTFPANRDECQIGMLRFELIQNISDRDSLITGRAIGFLQPLNGTGPNDDPVDNFIGDDQGNVTGVQCGVTNRCEFEITGLNISSTSEAYLRVRALYRDAPLKVEAFDSIGYLIELVGAQIEVDATGRAGGVIKRIKVRKQLQGTGSSNPAPEFALQSGNTICKQFTFRPGVVAIPSGLDACNPRD